MSRIAIVDSGTLLGAELKEGLERRPELCDDLRVLTSDEERVGMLTEVQGAAALVRELDEEALEGVELVFVCGDENTVRTALERIPETLPTVVVTSSPVPTEVAPRVAGVGPAADARRVRSPHPAVVAVVCLIEALRPLTAGAASATVVLPASVHDQAGLDELFAQTRALIAFSGERIEEVFGHQLAFNLLPGPGGAAATAELTAIVGDDPPVSLQLLQGGIFHGLGISLSVVLEDGLETDEIRRRLGEHEGLELVEEAATLGPIDGAAAPRVLIGEVRPDAGGTFWIWAVADNLTQGGALNAIALAEELLSA
jgi:aspartate-semialdehyde dehydrogenase